MRGGLSPYNFDSASVPAKTNVEITVPGAALQHWFLRYNWRLGIGLSTGFAHLVRSNLVQSASGLTVSVSVVGCLMSCWGVFWFKQPEVEPISQGFNMSSSGCENVFERILLVHCCIFPVMVIA